MKRYRVEWRVLGAWVPTDVFADYSAADAWAEKLLTSVDGRNGVRVLDTESPLRAPERVVWSVEG